MSSCLEGSTICLERLGDPKFSTHCNYVREMQPGELTLQFVQEHGLTQPLVLHSYEGLEMRLPPKGFSVQDVKKYVGARRQLDVIDCNTQESLTMSLGAWVRYYESAERERTLNVISLEFSHTDMSALVEAPNLVRQLDWAELIWPQSLKDQQTDPTNDITKMKYPKVQKYCLMSVAGCYTDFHIDFGGTSVWYHVFEGEKLFFLIPPTPDNYQAFHLWQKSGQQDVVFFPDTVLSCAVVHLHMGDTFFLPSGWIHGVYTPCDSLVFGGNFLHTCSIPAQVKVKEMEDVLKVPEKFRYPFYSQMHWYVLTAYSRRLQELGVGDKDHEENKVSSPPCCTDHLAITDKPILPLSSEGVVCRPHLPRAECEGLRHLLLKIRKDHLFTDDIPPCVPCTTTLLDRLEAQLNSPKLSTLLANTPNGVALINPMWTSENMLTSVCSRDGHCMTAPLQPAPLTSPREHKKLHRSPSQALNTPSSGAAKSRRRRCLVCAACQRPPCGNCKYCLDSPKYGGPGLLKQSCMYRKCQQLHQDCSSMETSDLEQPAVLSTLVVPSEEPADNSMDTCSLVPIETLINPSYNSEGAWQMFDEEKLPDINFEQTGTSTSPSLDDCNGKS